MNKITDITFSFEPAKVALRYIWTYYCESLECTFYHCVDTVNCIARKYLGYSYYYSYSQSRYIDYYSYSQNRFLSTNPPPESHIQERSFNFFRSRSEFSNLRDILHLPYLTANIDIELQLSLISQQRVDKLFLKFIAKLDSQRIDYPRVPQVTNRDFVRIYLNDPVWFNIFREVVAESE